MKRIRVGVLFGGKSAEHEVSILSARNVVAALDRSRFEPVLIGVDKSGRWLAQKEAALLGTALDPRLAKLNEGEAVAIMPGTITVAGDSQRMDVIFPVLHGPMGEDGTVQGLLELADIAYVGAGVLGSAVGMDKDVMKRLLKDAGIPITNHRTIRKSEFERDPDGVCRRAEEVGFPLFTKPANLGSSIGIRRVMDKTHLYDALAFAFSFDLKALTEAAVIGREIECSVLGNEDPIASLPGEVVVKHEDGFYSYDAKYLDENGAASEIPAKLPPEQIRQVQAMAIRTFLALECSGMARVDFFLQADGRLLVNEINTIPGFTAISQYPKLWEVSGIPQTELISRLIDLALERHAQKKQLKTSVEL